MTNIKSVLTAAVLAGASAAIADPETNATMGDRPKITQEVVKAVEPIIAHATNNEPWYQSRVMLGSVGTIVTSGVAIYGMIAAGITDGAMYAPPLVAILTAGFAIYGRVLATRPLGG